MANHTAGRVRQSLSSTPAQALPETVSQAHPRRIWSRDLSIDTIGTPLSSPGFQAQEAYLDHPAETDAPVSAGNGTVISIVVP